MRPQTFDRLQLLCQAYRIGSLSDRECRWEILDTLIKLPEPQLYEMVEEWLSHQEVPDSDSDDQHPDTPAGPDVSGHR
jgi:hypothetical protein